MIPATIAGGVRDPSRTKAKLKISTTTTARKVIVNSTSRLRHSMARSLAAIRSACLRKPERGRRRASPSTAPSASAEVSRVLAS